MSTPLPRRPRTPAPHPLDRVLRPRSVAVVGASRDPTKRGHQVVRSLLARPFAGSVFPVNPKGGEILGLPVTPAIADLEHDVDLAVVCTPAPTTPGVVEALAARGIPGAAVLAVGFRELGAEGARLEDRLRGAARQHGVRLVGPNTSGLLNLSVGLDLVGVPGVPAGRLALLTQSGNVALGIMREAATRGGEGFSFCVGMGNAADIALHEVLGFLETDPQTRAVLLYAEGFGSDGAGTGRAFLEAARRVGGRKPLVLLKGGRSEVGGRAARSHTGAVATGHAVVAAALRQVGIVEVRRSDELLAVGEALVRQPAARSGRGLAILADGGGQGTLAADTFAELGVPLAPLAEATRSALRQLLGPGAAVANPVDVAGAGDRDPGVFPRAARILLSDPGVSGVLVVGLFGGYHLRFAAELEVAEAEAARTLAGDARNAGKPLVVHSMYADAGASAAVRRLLDGGVPVIGSLEAACRAVAALWERGRPRRRRTADPGPVPPVLLLPPVRRIFRTARREGRTLLMETELRALLDRAGVPCVPARFCATRHEVEAAARALAPDPLALRIVSATVTHKTEAGGVALGVGGPKEAGRAHDRLVRAVRDWAADRGLDPAIRGVLVSPMLHEPLAELLVGVRRDPSFGPVLTVGAGGTRVELLADVALRVLPVDRGEVLRMLDELRIAPVLRGYRGRPPVSRRALTGLILGLSRFAIEHADIEELELNPVFAYRDRAVAVDARATLAAPPARSLSRRTTGA